MKFVKQLPALLILAFFMPANGYYCNLKTLCHKGHTVLLVSDYHKDDETAQLAILQHALRYGKDRSKIKLIIEDQFEYSGKNPILKEAASISLANQYQKGKLKKLAGCVDYFRRAGFSANSIEHRWYVPDANIEGNVLSEEEASLFINELEQTMKDITASAGKRCPSGSVITAQQAKTIKGFVKNLMIHTKKDCAEMYKVMREEPHRFYQDFRFAAGNNYDSAFKASKTHPELLLKVLDNYSSDLETRMFLGKNTRIIVEALDRARSALMKQNQYAHLSSIDALALNQIIEHAKIGNLTVIIAGGYHCANIELMLKKLVGYETVQSIGESLAPSSYLYRSNPQLFPEHHNSDALRLKETLFGSIPKSLPNNTVYHHTLEAIKLAEQGYSAKESISKASSDILDPEVIKILMKLTEKS